ncbi:MAG: hypothetical protein GQ536_10750, partial [Candidatus Aminicenantes bacterium]|nr:hypothetical protein [Candidatus Aminicenantes bacterium]
RMIKKSSLFVFVIAILFMISLGVSVAAQQDEQNLEQKIAQLKEKIQELAVKIERNPDAEKANEWREMHRKYINELEKLLAQSRPRKEERRLTDWEIAIKRAEGQLHEIESYLAQLRKKKESEEKIHEFELRLVKARNQLAELRAGQERGKRNAEKRPSAYQRERGELTAYVISATSEDVTVRLKDSGKVMVLRVSQWRRVENRRRVPNTDMIKMVRKLKKNQLIWARYNEGEERGTYFIQEIKKIKEDK